MSNGDPTRRRQFVDDPLSAKSPDTAVLLPAERIEDFEANPSEIKQLLSGARRSRSPIKRDLAQAISSKHVRDVTAGLAFHLVRPGICFLLPDSHRFLVDFDEGRADCRCHVAPVTADEDLRPLTE
jgi:hypothetical protein